MKRASILFVVLGLLIVAVTPAFAQSFNLLGPNGNRLIRDVDSDLVAFVWQSVAGATDYDLSLFKVSTNPRATIGTVFTVNVPTANCNATECFYTPTGPQYATMDTGEYAWTVVADLPSSDIEASNGPLYFSVNTAAIGLLANPGFETGTLAPWVASNLSGDKLKAGKGVGGSWGIQFNGSSTENAKLTQQVNVAYYGIDGNDELVLSGSYRAPNSSVKLQFIATVVYSAASGLAKDKVKLTAVVNGTFTQISSPFTPDGPVKKVKVDIIHKSLSAKLWVDDVQVTLSAP